MKLLISEKQYKTLQEDFNQISLKPRWHHERSALKTYLLNYGQLMVSRENGKEYKVLLDSFLSNELGINYCICIQFNSLTNETGDIIYVRAYDKFTSKVV